MEKKKIRVGLIIDEFFGGAGTAYGGYGFLARRHIAKYIPSDDIEVDVLIGRTSKLGGMSAKQYIVDGVNVYQLPKKSFFARQWLKKQNYDIYLSIELTYDFVLRNEPDLDKKLILWIQDPRPQYEWDEIKTVRLFPEPSYYNQDIYDLVHDWHQKNKVTFVSQGHFLNPKAKDLYNLADDTNIQYLPNPIDIDYEFDVSRYEKQNKIIFLGRIESVKRGWLFCEIARQMPDYEFYMLGQAFRDSDRNNSIIEQYKDIPNLHFEGHVDGEEKEQFLKDAKILINTSIHEALPISFLEALSYGTLLVSNRNPEDLTSKFGIHVGDVLGDGFDKINLYVDAVHSLLNDESKRQNLAVEAVKYIKEVHNTERFVNDLREVIRQNCKILS